MILKLFAAGIGPCGNVACTGLLASGMLSSEEEDNVAARAGE